uniref:Uncharacterized LOC107716443 n=1 Tax=Sinocyclocheilus rhinocerous TaxID=307959 RepID=A0A673H0Y0_9TELE
ITYKSITMMQTHKRYLWIILPCFIASLTVTITWGTMTEVAGPGSVYVAVKAVCWLGNRQRNRLEADTRDIHRVQQEILLKRLQKHSNTLSLYCIISDTETFQQRHPITDYDHYEKFVERMAKGEQNVLIPEKPLILAMTSGTSGSSRMLLSTKDTNTELFLQGVTVCLDAMRQAFPATGWLQKTLKLFYSPIFRQSEAGIPIGPNSSTPASSKHMLHLYTTPAPIYQVLNDRDALYLHLLFGLKDHYLGMLESNFSSTVFYAFRALQVLYSEVQKSETTNENLGARSPSKRLAALAVKHSPAARHFQLGARNPNKRLTALSVKHSPVPSPLQLSPPSEITILALHRNTNARPTKSRLRTSIFLYFFPSYVVKVVGFHNQCPKVEFHYTLRGQMLSVRGEKVSESLFLGALKRAVTQWPGAKLIDCCVESGSASGIAQPHYLVFVELKGVRNLSEEQRYKITATATDSDIYRSFRMKGSIGPMRVQLVCDGTFQELKDRLMAFSSTSSNTFKMQRVIRRREFADFLLQRAFS